MEILSAGAFINLGNQEKIEQLKYTARELANAANSTEGVVNEEEPARKLAIEFWQGLEYMCRENEQATVQNIFTGHFLECLRDLRGQSAPAANLSETTLTPITAVSAIQSVSERDVPKDEFLGIIAPSHTPENTDLDVSSEAVEMVAESSLTNLFPAQDNPSQIVQEAETLAEESGKDEFLAVETLPSPETFETKNESEPEPENSEQSLPPQVQPTSAGEKSNLPTSQPMQSASNKEPYRWEKCTVTATIQLLPSGEGSRKVVLSVRTHDFTPQISLIEISGEATPAALLPFLENVFAAYRNDLPLKVMEKMKQEKTKGKKQPTKPATVTKASDVTKTQSVSRQSDEQGEVKTTELPPPPPVAQRVQESLQGSLF